MTKTNAVIISLAVVALFILRGCAGSGSSSSSALNLTGTWQLATSGGTSGTVVLTQHGTQVTGSLSAPNYYGPVPGMSHPGITGTLTGTTLQATITGSYGPYVCGGGIINIDITITLTGTVATGGNSMSGQFVTLPATCFSGGSGTWSANRM